MSVEAFYIDEFERSELELTDLKNNITIIFDGLNLDEERIYE